MNRLVYHEHDASFYGWRVGVGLVVEFLAPKEVRHAQGDSRQAINNCHGVKQFRYGQLLGHVSKFVLRSRN